MKEFHITQATICKVHFDPRINYISSSEVQRSILLNIYEHQNVDSLDGTDIYNENSARCQNINKVPHGSWIKVDQKVKNQFQLVLTEFRQTMP